MFAESSAAGSLYVSKGKTDDRFSRNISNKVTNDYITCLGFTSDIVNKFEGKIANLASLWYL